MPYLPNYKNPCWFEEVDPDTIYKDNVYMEFKDPDHSIRNSFDKFISTLRSRKENDGFSWALRCLPYFYVAGAPRCGTTDLYASMVRHKQIALLVGKEGVYWNRMRYLSKY